MVAVSLRFRTVYVKDFDEGFKPLSIAIVGVEEGQSLVTSCFSPWKRASCLATFVLRNRVSFNVSLSELVNTRDSIICNGSVISSSRSQEKSSYKEVCFMGVTSHSTLR